MLNIYLIIFLAINFRMVLTSVIHLGFGYNTNSSTKMSWEELLRFGAVNLEVFLIILTYLATVPKPPP